LNAEKGNREMRKIVLTTAMAVLLGVAACKPKEGAGADPRTGPRGVAVARVVEADAISSQYTGVVGARVESDLGFRVSGKVVERLVDTGQAVRKGQRLMHIDPTDYTHAAVAQTGNVAAARAKWVQAAADERRDRGLAATGAISHSAYDAVKAASDSAKALLEAAVAQERVARNQEAYSFLVADSDATVMRTLAEPGQVVAPGQVVVQLAHAGPREAVVSLPESVRPALGAPAMATLFGGGPSMPARLRQLSDSADPRTRTYEARFVLTGSGADAPLGATVTIALIGSGPPLLGVPTGAIDDEGHGPGVWMLDAKDSTVNWRSVRLQSLGIELATLTGGVAEGDMIVASGGHYLHEGERVRPLDVRADMR
jgi:RND family efflux transporter MFP subunit